MMRSLKVEMKKLLGCRSTWLIVGALLAVTLVATLQTAIASESGKPLPERQGFFFATIQVQLFVLILGAKFVTDDFRYGSIVPALLAAPKRSRFVAAKLGVLAVAGAVAATLATAFVLAGSWTHLGNGIDARELRSIAGLIVAGALWSMIGGAVGFLVRHQVGAIVGLIVWTVVLDQMFAGRLGRAGMWLPGEAGSALAIAPTTRTMLTAAAILVTYACVSGVVSAAMMQRRDVL
jgi:ABC-type transport system involved in multi-copper enzyme maturation permease subunit